MAIGPGKYDNLCTKVVEEAGAIAAIIVVFDGTLGSGFSVQAPWELTAQLPSILRNLATKIEEDRKAGGPESL